MHKITSEDLSYMGEQVAKGFTSGRFDREGDDSCTVYITWELTSFGIKANTWCDDCQEA